MKFRGKKKQQNYTGLELKRRNSPEPPALLWNHVPVAQEPLTHLTRLTALLKWGIFRGNASNLDFSQAGRNVTSKLVSKNGPSWSLNFKRRQKVYEKKHLMGI